MTIEEIEKLTDEEIETQISNRIYTAALFFERLEHAQRVWGNGHHIAQNLSQKAIEMYRERKRDAPAK